MLDEWAALAGKVAVIPGGAGGMGRSCAVALARAGVAVAVCDRDEAGLAEVAEEIAALDVPSTFAHFDVRDSDALAAFYDQVDREHGRVDIVVNIVGGGFRAQTIDMTANGTMAVIRQNFVYLLESCQHAARRMIAQGTGGSIVNMSTIEARRAMPDMGVFGAMKAAVEHLTMTMAVELGPHGIRVNAIAPDHFPSRETIGVGFDDPDQTGPLAQLENALSIPLQRKGEGRDTAGVVLFLASQLSSYVTGTTMLIDGGTASQHGWLNWPTEGWRNLVPRSVLATLDDA
jgi:NAD(P)-dependent dehydrogenase (short-subunit alcohol dehydrogenase family)